MADLAPFTKQNRLDGFIALFFVLIATAITGFTAADQPEITRFNQLYYGKFLLSALIAVITPHLLFPFERPVLTRLANPDTATLFKILFRRLSGVILVSCWLAAVLLFTDHNSGIYVNLERVFMLVDFVLFTTGITLFGLIRYIAAGDKSQKWKEGTAGQKYHQMRQETGAMMVDPGAVPTIITTSSIFISGILVILITRTVSTAAGSELWGISGLMLVILGTLSFLRNRTAFITVCYQSDAFFREYTQEIKPATAESDERDLRYESVYWIPTRWKPAGWAALKQMDRLYPFGRYIALGHLLYWLMLYQNADVQLVRSYLYLFVLFHQLPIYLHGLENVSPGSFNWFVQRWHHWFLTRFFLQLRWLIPLLGSLLLTSWLSPAVTAGWTLDYGGLFLLSTLLVALLVTLVREFRYPMNFK